MKPMRILLLTLGCALAAVTARAQTLQLKPGNFNSLYIAPATVPVGSNDGTFPATADSNFRSVGGSAGSDGPISESAIHGDRYPSVPDNSLVLTMSTTAGPFSSGAPLFSMGDEITPPLTNEAGTEFSGTDEQKLAAARAYWRAQPVLPGEILPNFGGGSPLIPLGSVTVTASDVEKTVIAISVSPAPTGLVVGATLLGQPITKIAGTTVTLAGKANETITSGISRPITPVTDFYYSPHADKVYASQPGPVSITWVNKLLTQTRVQDFVVDGNPGRPVRRMYWTEGSFDGPKVQITDARITTIYAAFNRAVPKAVPEEVSIPGYTPLIPNLTTLSFDKFNGIGQLHAYNVEGRVLIEYLGNVRLGNLHNSLGTDVVEIIRDPVVNLVSQNLGAEIRPRTPALAGDDQLAASPVLTNTQGTASYYATTARPDGALAYYAERTTSDANSPDNGQPVSSGAYNKVVFYWLESFPENFGIRWPKFQSRYWQRWSPNLSDYAHYTVDTTGSTAATGVSFPGGTLPTIVYQDDPAQAEAAIDINSQRLFVTFAPTNPVRRNRSLLKFASNQGLWYVNLYSQAEGRQHTSQSFVSNANGVTTVTVGSTAGLEAGMVVTGPGITGTATVVRILNGSQYVLSSQQPVPNTAGVATAAAIPNPSFEANEFSNGVGYASENGNSATSITGWVLEPTNRVGLNPIAGGYSPFADNGTIPDGTHVAFIQSINGVPSTLSTTITGLTAGQLYTVSFRANRRSGYGGVPDASWSLNGGDFVPFTASPPVNSYYTVTGVFAATGNTAALAIRNVNDSDGTLLVDAFTIGTVTNTLTYTVEPDAMAPINAAATVGTRIAPPAGHEIAGYISGGTCYYPGGYLNPFTVGVPAANLGAIIPVNALPGNNLLTVRWFRKIPAPGSGFSDFFVPGKVGRYTVSFPAATDRQIVIAEGVGTGDLDPELSAGNIYYQNDKTAAGYNPNEEHAVMIGTRAYALRDDLNMISPQQSQPFVLLAYTDAADRRPAMKVYKVVREVDLDGDRADSFDILFDRPAVAGNLLVSPYPLPLMELPFDSGGVCQNAEVTPASGQDPASGAGALPEWGFFTKKDRKGFHWIYRGPHDGASISKRISMRYKYVSRPGFFLPNSSGTGAEVAPGTLLPFLRPLDGGVPQGDPVTGTPLTIDFIPRWPEQAAELRVGETLTLPKFGLPQVRGQVSANVFYQQSLALATAKPSVTLHDPTREKTVRLQAVGLEELPDSIATTNYLGKTYFQRLSPDLQQRIWFDPLRGGGFDSSGNQLKPGSLVLAGQFMDEIAGEDYLHLNVLTERQITTLKGLCTETGAVKTKWDSAIDGLSTKVETYIENPQRQGTYIVDGPRTVNVGEDQLARITDSDTAVDSYALTATGEGAGWVSMIFGNGEAFTPEGDPVLVKVFKVVPTLYTGELKTIYSKNPLDEQVTLRHTGDFAARPQDYEFEWKWAPASATAPATYTSSWASRIGGTNNQWAVYRNTSEAVSGAVPARAVRVTGGDPGEGLDLSGNFRYAFNVGPLDWNSMVPGFAGDAYFTDDADSGITVTAPEEVAEYLELALPGVPSFADQVIQSVYRSLRGAAAPDKVTVGLDRLNRGSRYKLQLLFGDYEPNRRFDVTVGGIMVMKDFCPFLANGGTNNTGAAIVYEFIAADTYLNISLDAATSTEFPGISRIALLNGVTLEEMAAGYGGVVSFPRSIAVNDARHDPASGLPGLLLTKPDSLDFTGGVPGEIVFSAAMGDLDGFVLYINDAVALAHQAPAGFANTDALSGLVPGNSLARQFRVPRSFFRAGTNTVKVAVYSDADANAPTSLDFRLDVTQEADVTATTFQPVSDPGPNQKNTNVALIGGDPSLPFGGSTFVLNDRWFTMRYRPKPGVTNIAGAGYSRWMSPQLVEGWIKRVLREINPFEQRVKDLFNNAISTDSSVLTQAGTRWEGDIALTLDNIENVGLIAIYETVLNRARSMSIDANTNDPDTNQALMLAAGYLSDLYTLLGHEAYADAANPTISTDDANDSIEINTSRFSFENQVANSLDEELALLRGRDASGTRVEVSPAYNRLYWNYTGGINAGEAIYATNYNIKEKAGSSTADGVIDAADAQRMYPQGHGDAYGHYLTALKGYYRLLANPNFSWQRRAEAVLVLGQAVTVDFVDERKFAGDASFLAQAAQQICALTYRQQYQDGAPGWSHYRDTATAPNTAEKRNWGLDEWVSRSAQGAYYHWVVGNAMLPDVDTYHTGVEKIDRTTVPELNELATSLASFQTAVDNASARLNPLGISPGAIQFDIDSTFLEVGSTAGIGDNAVQGMGHFDQIRERAMKTLSNASGAFEQAARMTRSLRNQENQLDDYNSLIVDQERTFRNQLIEIYGRPYEGDVGPGKTYKQGYYGPDLYQWFVVDRPNALVDTTVSDSVKFRIWKVTDREFKIPSLDGDGLIRDYDIYSENGQVVRENVEVTAYPNQFIQYADKWLPALGARPETGELQGALLDAHRAFLVLKDAIYNVKVLQHRFLREGNLLKEAILAHQQHLSAQDATRSSILLTMGVQQALNAVAETAEIVAGFGELTGEAATEMYPQVVGLAVDPSFPARGVTKFTAGAVWLVAKVVAGLSRSAAGSLDVRIAGSEMSLDRLLDAIGFSLEEKQMVYELENLYRDLTTQEYALAHPLAAYQAANERVASVLGRGQRIQEEREAFRKRAAAVVQGYRTKDVTFRVFRNEALEQYRSLFDLASRYTYMAAKAYDYETGLLGTTEGQAFMSGIVSSRSLGDIRDGEVFATVSSLGDNGLAGAMAKMHADHRVAEGRLGINNPEIYSTLFSMRGENFRILDDPDSTADDEAWQQTLEQFFVANLLADSDVAALCRNVKRPDGRPVPGIIIPFSTTIRHGLNFFGLPLAAGDHTFTATNFSTKIQSLGIALPGYVGMDEYASGDPTAGTPALTDPDALSATPYLYVIPTGTDYMYAPPLGNELFERSWKVEDQAMPLPFNIGASQFNNIQFFNANGTLTEKPWIIRQHQSFRPVADPSILLGGLPTEFTSHRLAGRSVWNSGWKIVIPAYTLLNNEQEGLTRFAKTVRDIRLFIRSYSYSGN